MACPASYGAEGEELVEAQLAVEDVAAGQAVLLLEIERRERMDVLDRAADVQAR